MNSKKIFSITFTFLMSAVLTPIGLVAEARAEECSDSVLQKVLMDPAVDGKKDVSLSCDLKLRSSDVVRKRIILKGSEASGVTIDCNGGNIIVANRPQAILITSIKGAGNVWDRPSDITIRDCSIKGGIRVQGMGANGEALEVKKSSQSKGHTKRAQDAAPTRITLNKLHLIAAGGIPLYVSPGTTRVSLLNSLIEGSTDSVNIYLDTESGYNVIKNNRIHANSSKRELIAVDGSANNVIANNKFSSLHNGGVYLYRNCGEGGTIRHQSPQSNLVSNNYFYYDKFDGTKKEWIVETKKVFGITVKIPKLVTVNYPSVYLGSRNGNRGYCDLDKGKSFGSSGSDLDYVRSNAVIDNQIVKLSPSKMILTNNPGVNSNNLLDKNSTVASYIKRESRCFKVNGFPKKVMKPLQVQHQIIDSQNNPVETKFSYQCDDGEITNLKN